jgi:hypothetical protein
MDGQWRVPESSSIADRGGNAMMIAVCFEHLLNLDCAILGSGCAVTEVDHARQDD